MASPLPPINPTFSTLYLHLQTTNPAPVLPPSKPPSSSSTSNPTTTSIASLSLHPTLEAALHILNNDLPSAHFLVRHMQSPPAWEGMFLHGILHRVEGDYDNARAWYRSASASGSGSEKGEGEVFSKVWPGGVGDGHAFIDEIEAFVKTKNKNKKKGNENEKGEDEDVESRLEKESRREIDSVVSWCRTKFGDGEWKDASAAWVKPSEEHRKMAEDMVVGGEGWRTF